ncbi:MAG TPA: ornithine cyclodeaminase family protein [Actinomycetota bacterium]|nr:ornithine cyclodeaminase family protein [Actinomycetota bacterium]
MTAAIDALEAAFAATERPEAPLRSHIETSAGTLLMMPSHGEIGVGVKLVTLTPTNAERGLPFIHAAYVLFDRQTQAPVALFDGAAITALRTAAVSGVATRHLAREGASRLVLFGAGVQARSHLDAMRAVRGISTLRVVSRGRDRAADLVEQARAGGVDASVGSAGDEHDADVICTCTTSVEPVLAGANLPEGVHVNAVGAYTTSMRELDAQAVARSKVVVETREAAEAEAGDLALAIRDGAIGVDHVRADLHDVVTGTPVRTSDKDRTLFKSVGIAFEDLVVARAAADRL